MRVSMEKPSDRTTISIDSKSLNYEACNLFNPAMIQLQPSNEKRNENEHESKTKRIIDSNSSQIRFGVFSDQSH